MQSHQITLSERRRYRQQLVENKISFSGPDAELCIYDTYHPAAGVRLAADQLLYCGMVQGKKIMHASPRDNGEIFLPHESYVIPGGKYIEIDFPEARECQPTVCLTLEIPCERIAAISERMRDLTSLDEIGHNWEYQPRIFHNHHTRETQQLLERLVGLFTQNQPDREIMVDLAVTELIIKLLRQQSRDVLLGYCRQRPDANALSAVLDYLETHPSKPLDMEALCHRARMSRSKLYREFKKQLDCSPGEYHLQLRLQNAAQMLRKGNTVTMACYGAGFKDPGHFCRSFSRFFGCTPRQFRARQNAEAV